LSISRPLTSWDSTRKLFTISIPVSQYTQPAQAGFAGDFFSLFNSSKVVRESEDADAWADLGSDSSPVTAGKIEATDAFPDISTVERPEVLSLKPPYWLQIRQEDYSTITVTASHGPSLGFIEAYLKKWCRGNVNLVNRVSVASPNILIFNWGCILIDFEASISNYYIARVSVRPGIDA